jgi:hypothetical protein
MAMNRIQSQQGMSLLEFMSSFDTKAQCAELVKQARWSQGFQCPRRARAMHYVVGHGGRKLFQCQGCSYQASLTADCLFVGTKLPLKTWSLAIYLQTKTRLSALALKPQVGVSYPTAWLMRQKIVHAMVEREGQHRPNSTRQLDDANLGGERSCGNAGRSSENQVPFVAVASIGSENHPYCVKLAPVNGFTLEAGHTPSLVGQRKSCKPHDPPEVTWINTLCCPGRVLSK